MHWYLIKKERKFRNNSKIINDSYRKTYYNFASNSALIIYETMTCGGEHPVQNCNEFLISHENVWCIFFVILSGVYFL